MAEKQFPNGIRAFKPNDKAPDFVKVDLTINKSELTTWLQSQPDTIRLSIKESQKGTYYIEVNTFTPQPQNAPNIKEDDLPF